MSSKPSAAAARAANTSRSPSHDKLAAMQALASEARDLDLSITELEERLKEKKASLNDILLKRLPDMMEEAGVNVIGLPQQGNMPALEARLRPYYSANIAASWDKERKDKAFRWLEEHGHGDLIKTQVTVAFPRGNLEIAHKLAEQASKKKGASVDIKETVPGQTLTAWLKEEIEKRKTIPPKETLDLLGATVGKKVDFKEPK